MYYRQLLVGTNAEIECASGWLDGGITIHMRSTADSYQSSAIYYVIRLSVISLQYHVDRRNPNPTINYSECRGGAIPNSPSIR